MKGVRCSILSPKPNTFDGDTIAAEKAKIERREGQTT